MDAGVEPGKVWRQWRVVERRIETPNVVSFVLRPADGVSYCAARPGPHLYVGARLAGR